MAVKKGSKNNVANRGAKAKIKFYGGKQVREVKLVDRKSGATFMAAQYENGEPVVSPDGSFVKYSSIQEYEGDSAK
ncbi:MAG: hypothetical protein K0R73_864 [Candidatus Midichloriaceae bacterium]|jgi:hypothetical protein|nr:hypothetical protein [Candidatus Midichloriaceae bacterium]